MPTIPLDDDDVSKLARLAFAWDCSPQEALRRSLDASLAAEAEHDLIMELDSPAPDQPAR